MPLICSRKRSKRQTRRWRWWRTEEEKNRKCAGKTESSVHRYVKYHSTIIVNYMQLFVFIFSPKKVLIAKNRTRRLFRAWVKYNFSRRVKSNILSCLLPPPPKKKSKFCNIAILRFADYWLNIELMYLCLTIVLKFFFQRRTRSWTMVKITILLKFSYLKNHLSFFFPMNKIHFVLILI